MFKSHLFDKNLFNFSDRKNSTNEIRLVYIKLLDMDRKGRGRSVLIPLGSGHSWCSQRWAGDGVAAAWRRKRAVLAAWNLSLSSFAGEHNVDNLHIGFIIFLWSPSSSKLVPPFFVLYFISFICKKTNYYHSPLMV